MKSSVLTLYLMFLVFGIMQAFNGFRDHFNGNDALRTKVANLKVKIEQDKLKIEMAQFQVKDFEQNVATLMPGALKHSSNYSLRALASVVDKGTGEAHSLTSAKVKLEKGRDFFREGEYRKAITLFKEIRDSFSSSPQVVDAMFLLSESYFHMGDNDSLMDTVESMLNQFPENDLTGFALLRMAHVLREMDRLDEAEEVYHTILSSYKYPPLIQQTKISLREIKL